MNSLKPSFLKNDMSSYISRDYRTNQPRGTFNSQGDFIPIQKKNAPMITSRQNRIAYKKGNFTDDNSIYIPPTYRFIGNTSQQRKNYVSDMKGGQVKNNDVKW